MACHSGGSVEIYIEPLLPARRLLIFGVSPTAQALARLAAVLGYRVEAVDPEASETLFPDVSRLVTSDESIEPPGSEQDADRCFAVVATLGQRDEEAAWAAGQVKPAYVGRGGQPQAVRTDTGNPGRTRRHGGTARPDRQSGRPRHRRGDARGDCPEHPRRDHPARPRRAPPATARPPTRPGSSSRRNGRADRAGSGSRQGLHGRGARPGSRRGRPRPPSAIRCAG